MYSLQTIAKHSSYGEEAYFHPLFPPNLKKIFDLYNHYCLEHLSERKERRCSFLVIESKGNFWTKGATWRLLYRFLFPSDLSVSFESSILSIEYFIYEICSLMWPSRRNLLWSNLNLFAQNLISNLFSVSSIIWSSPKHKFICNYPNSIVVYWERMILSAHNLWCHIAWSTTSISIVIRLNYSCNAKICDSDITLIIKH